MDGRTSNCPNQIFIITHDKFGVCDGAHSRIVMKKFSCRLPVASVRLEKHLSCENSLYALHCSA